VRVNKNVKNGIDLPKNGVKNKKAPMIIYHQSLIAILII